MFLCLKPAISKQLFESLEKLSAKFTLYCLFLTWVRKLILSLKVRLFSLYRFLVNKATKKFFFYWECEQSVYVSSKQTFVLYWKMSMAGFFLISKFLLFQFKPIVISEFYLESLIHLAIMLNILSSIKLRRMNY